MDSRPLTEALPPDVADTLARRASLLGRTPEEQAVSMLTQQLRAQKHLSIDEAWAKIQASGLQTPREAEQWVREDRDAR